MTANAKTKMHATTLILKHVYYNGCSSTIFPAETFKNFSRDQNEVCRISFAAGVKKTGFNKKNIF